MMISLPIVLNLIYILSEVGCSLSVEDVLSKDLLQYLSNFKSEIERAYEDKLNLIKGEFKREVKSLQDEFQRKENDYRSRIELLERKVGSINNSQGSLEDILTHIVTQRLQLDAGKEKSKKKSIEHVDDLDSNENRSKSGIHIIRRQLSPEVENKIAFFASITKEVRHMGANQDIVFDKIVTNKGSAYNGHHGTFISPVAGTYVFFTTLHASGNETWGHFMVNGVIVAKIHLKGVQSSQTVIAHLNKGDDVSIQNSALDKGLHGDMYSTFGGFLLFEDTGFGTEIIGK